MSKIKADLKARGVYFSENLPSYKQVLNVFAGDSAKSFTGKTLDVFAGDPAEKFTGKKTKALFSPLVICDRKLYMKKQIRTNLKLWLKNHLVYFVSAGEQLKNVENFSAHINSILKKTKDKKISGFISLGGGSVGDFTGFLASVYKRGVPLVHIPSTWLSALDSAHGGKTALNAGSVKNMLGSYFFPRAVFIAREIFSSLPKEEKESAQGELTKIALIEGGSFYTKWLKKKGSHLNIWDFLPQAILAKLKIVAQDPYDKNGLRAHLNLGHTLGHVLESYFGLKHGEAVRHGLVFSLQWSHNRFGLADNFLKEISFLIKKKDQLNFYLKKIPDKTLKKKLLHDKKRVAEEHIQFVFLKGPGKALLEKVSARDIIQEIKRQARLPV